MWSSSLFSVYTLFIFSVLSTINNNAPFVDAHALLPRSSPAPDPVVTPPVDVAPTPPTSTDSSTPTSDSSSAQQPTTTPESSQPPPSTAPSTSDPPTTSSNPPPSTTPASTKTSSSSSAQQTQSSASSSSSSTSTDDATATSTSATSSASSTTDSVTDATTTAPSTSTVASVSDIPGSVTPLSVSQAFPTQIGISNSYTVTAVVSGSTAVSDDGSSTPKTGFLSHPGSVAAVFVVIGLLATAGGFWLFTFCMRRRRLARHRADETFYNDEYKTFSTYGAPSGRTRGGHGSVYNTYEPSSPQLVADSSTETDLSEKGPTYFNVAGPTFDHAYPPTDPRRQSAMRQSSYGSTTGATGTRPGQNRQYGAAAAANAGHPYAYSTDNQGRQMTDPMAGYGPDE
ncbi:hypothetical protein SISNIDRAFT_546704 [Sistotremastrum niveocremeum HHB9708]|uniref:Mid2 domain-containing protein n=2 Tax=Sistotremastraceae TaxID=3402574 RepID=A0A164ZCY9_9AGAM|nr:hypothetical protein SISNIDRAFT_546704 [Sistotremastrum niveocremeum HHB9708]KZT39647.1 hypothetical protein SISSUDRAFT_1127900 [Sistotremastrum suecicum HHB10207 ss-3]